MGQEKGVTAVSAGDLVDQLTEEDGPFPCPEEGCARVLEDRELLAGHLMAVHRKEATVKHRCDECGKEFDSVQGVTLHRTRAHRMKGAESSNGQVADDELRTMAQVLDLVESLSPEGRAWLAARLGSGR